MKKIFFVIVLFLTFSGIATGSSLNGDYKGSPIVNVAVNGKTVVSDVPAINLDGTTLIPLRAVSEALGASVSWEDKTQTANIVSKIDFTSENYNKSVVSSVNQQAIANGGSNFSISYDGSGSLSTIQYNGVNDTNIDTKNIISLLILSGLSMTDKNYVIFYKNGVNEVDFFVTNKNIEDVSKGTISYKQFEDLIQVVDHSSNKNQTQNNSFSNNQNNSSVSQAICNAIISNYDLAWNNTRANLEAHGMGNSSYMDQLKKSNDEKKNAELFSKGCPVPTK